MEKEHDHILVTMIIFVWFLLLIIFGLMKRANVIEWDWFEIITCPLIGLLAVVIILLAYGTNLLAKHLFKKYKKESEADDGK